MLLYYIILVIVLLGCLGFIKWDSAALNLTDVFISVFMTKVFFFFFFKETVKLYFVAFSLLSFLETIMYYIVKTVYNIGNPFHLLHRELAHKLFSPCPAAVRHSFY